MNMNIKTYIENNFLNKSKKLNSRKINSKFINSTSMSLIFKETAIFDVFKPTLKTRLNLILSDIKAPLICEVCNNPHIRYKTNTCSFRCANKHPERIKKIKNNTNYEQLHEKRVITCLNKYGANSFTGSVVGKEKIKNSVIKKYGVNNIKQLDTIKQKAIDTFNNNFPLNSEKRYQHFSKLGKDKQWNGNIDEIEEFLKNGNTVKDFSLKNNVAFSTIYNFIKRENREDLITGFYSSTHKKITLELEKLNINFIINDQKQIHPYQLDVFIPNHNLAIEVNGVFWHDEKKTPNNYHLMKTKLCENKKIQLLHFWDTEINKDINLVMSIIKSYLNLNDIIYARKCNIKQISSQEAKSFQEQNHLQGFHAGKVYLGLFLNNKLIQTMSFGKSRFNKKYEWELIRFCSLKNTKIVGGASRLFRYFLKEYKPHSIISYCDRRIFSGKTYEILGLELIHNSTPNYWYHNNTEVFSRIKFQKHKLNKLYERGILKTYNSTLSEKENMILNGFNRIYDCGNSVWAKTYQQ